MTAPTPAEAEAAAAKAKADAEAKAKAGEKKLSIGQLVTVAVRDKLARTAVTRSAVVVSCEEGEDVVLRLLAPELVTAAADDVEPITAAA